MSMFLYVCVVAVYWSIIGEYLAQRRERLAYPNLY